MPPPIGCASSAFVCGSGFGLSAATFAHAFDLAGLLLGNGAAATIVGVGVGLAGASGLCSDSAMAGAEAEVLSEATVLLSQYVSMTVVTAGATPPDAVGECCAEVNVEAEVASEIPLSRGCCGLRALLRSATHSHSRSRSYSCAVQCKCAGAGRSTLIKCVSESLDREAHADADGDEDCGGQGTPAAAADPLLAGADAEAVAASRTMLADLLRAVS